MVSYRQSHPKVWKMFPFHQSKGKETGLGQKGAYFRGWITLVQGSFKTTLLFWRLLGLPVAMGTINLVAEGLSGLWWRVLLGIYSAHASSYARAGGGGALTAGMPPAAGGHRCYTLLAIPPMNPCSHDCCWGTLAGKEFQWVWDKLV